MNVEHIIQGWANVIKDKFNLLDPELKKKAEEKLLICNECEVRTGNNCDPGKKTINLKTGREVKGCGCNLSAKVLSDASCPASKW